MFTKIIIITAALFSLAGCTYGSTTSSSDTASTTRSQTAPAQDSVKSQNATESSNTAGDVAPSREIAVDLSEFSFSPSELTLTAGQKVELKLTNTGRIGHTFTVPELNIDESLGAGQTKNITVVAPTTGTFELLCTVPGHKERGMHGSVQVN